MCPRPAVLKTDHPMRIVILSKRSAPKDLSSPSARPFTPLPAYPDLREKRQSANQRHLPWYPASAVGACGDSSLFHESPACPDPVGVTDHGSPSFPSLSFQSLTTIKFSNPLVFTTIRNAGGCTYPPASPPRKIPSRFRTRPPHLPSCSVSAGGACCRRLRPCRRDSCTSASALNLELSTLDPRNPFRINTCRTVSKQTTLSTFKINTYAKTGVGVARSPRLASFFSSTYNLKVRTDD